MNLTNVAIKLKRTYTHQTEYTIFLSFILQNLYLTADLYELHGAAEQDTDTRLGHKHAQEDRKSR